MVKKIVALLFAGFMVSSVASAELPVIVDIKPKEINKDPVVREYASALWESFNWDSSDTTFATVVSGEGMRRIVVQVMRLQFLKLREAKRMCNLLMV